MSFNIFFLSNFLFDSFFFFFRYFYSEILRKETEILQKKERIRFKISKCQYHITVKIAFISIRNHYIYKIKERIIAKLKKNFIG